MHSLGIVQWNSTRRDHPGNLGGVFGSGPVTLRALISFWMLEFLHYSSHSHFLIYESFLLLYGLTKPLIYYYFFFFFLSFIVYPFYYYYLTIFSIFPNLSSLLKKKKGFIYNAR